MNIKENYYYTKEHEWAQINNNKAKIGITDYAQSKLGDITYVEVIDKGKNIKQFEILTTIESVKSASEIYSPITGIVSLFNNKLETNPELINQSCYEEGFIAELENINKDEIKNLMDHNAYREYLKGLE